MASKTGFEYYGADTDRFEDTRIKRLRKKFKGDGFAVYDYILAKVYRKKGYFLTWDSELCFDVADYWEIEEETVLNIVNFCCSVGLFHAEFFNEKCILTSQSIQRRFIEMSVKAKRKDFTIREDLDLLTEYETQLHEDGAEIQEVEDKVKYSKVKESINSAKALVGETPPVADNQEENKSIENEEPEIDPEPSPDLKSEFESCASEINLLAAFIEKRRPEFCEPYSTLWNLFAAKYGKPKILNLSPGRRRKLRTRIRERPFDLVKTLRVAVKSSFLMESNFFSFDWIIENEKNYLKVLEGNYANKPQKESTKNTDVNGQLAELKRAEARTLELAALNHGGSKPRESTPPG